MSPPRHHHPLFFFSFSFFVFVPQTLKPDSKIQLRSLKFEIQNSKLVSEERRNDEPRQFWLKQSSSKFSVFTSPGGGVNQNQIRFIHRRVHHLYVSPAIGPRQLQRTPVPKSNGWKQPFRRFVRRAHTPSLWWKLCGSPGRSLQSLFSSRGFSPANSTSNEPSSVLSE